MERAVRIQLSVLVLAPQAGCMLCLQAPTHNRALLTLQLSWRLQFSYLPQLSQQTWIHLHRPQFWFIREQHQGQPVTYSFLKAKEGFEQK